jgi:hypothetical protein
MEKPNPTNLRHCVRGFLPYTKGKPAGEESARLLHYFTELKVFCFECGLESCAISTFTARR